MQILNIIQFQNCSYILPFLFFFSFCIYLSMSLPKYHRKVLLDTRLNFITLENAETSEEQVGSYSKRMTSTNWLQHCTEKKAKEKWENTLPGVFCGWNKAMAGTPGGPRSPLLEDTVDGSIDHKGRPAKRPTSGGWRSAYFIMGTNH